MEAVDVEAEEEEAVEKAEAVGVPVVDTKPKS